MLIFDPRRAITGKNPLQFCSRNPNWVKYMDFLLSETRFKMAKELFEQKMNNSKKVWNYYQRLSKMDYKEE
ncbi:hypothetical protein [Streptobacillus felis]|uniref:hypothetical protein n=1 Tax=Streptobacillus felis TaxID=1384509 RepID=UPI000835D82A|nr:hypothetical protein [Streptobacillus felis]